MTRRAVLTCLALLTGGASAQFAPATPVPSPYLFVQPIPNQPDLDLSGEYVGRLRGQNNQTGLLDISVKVSGYDVTASVFSRALKQSFQASGTRSIFRASPVTVNLVGQSGQGSACEGGFTELYQVNVTFVRASELSGEGGRGSIQRMICDSVTRQFRPDPQNSGELEVARK
ncbi:hypothetical protein [Deinococcus sp. NW-56]|uniref:hypothetical protein n=1 Tax=Deinococcus sp. NW-56 TaxID=2080419 RepID=UPI000CF3806E|nr:hypothetical protein [Deinococcus sp. NW-56]